MLPSSFADVPPRVDTATCTVCRERFAPGDRAADVKIVAGIGRHPHHGRPTAFVNEDEYNERAHVDCRNRQLASPRIFMPPPTSSVGQPDVRDSDARCPVCGNAFRRGDRIVSVTVVIGVEKDPETKRPAAKCYTEQEHVHFNCRDPQLVTGVLVIS
jgi:hypothetical protein